MVHIYHITIHFNQYHLLNIHHMHQVHILHQIQQIFQQNILLIFHLHHQLHLNHLPITLEPSCIPPFPYPWWSRTSAAPSCAPVITNRRRFLQNTNPTVNIFALFDIMITDSNSNSPLISINDNIDILFENITFNLNTGSMVFIDMEHLDHSETAFTQFINTRFISNKADTNAITNQPLLEFHNSNVEIDSSNSIINAINYQPLILVRNSQLKFNAIIKNITCPFGSCMIIDSGSPTPAPTNAPILPPSHAPTVPPTFAPTMTPINPPSATPSFAPVINPTMTPTLSPSISPTISSTTPTLTPTSAPSTPPTANPTKT
eukprot:326016_1